MATRYDDLKKMRNAIPVSMRPEFDRRILALDEEISQFNVARQKTIEALADALLLARRPLTQTDLLSDEAWAQIDAALTLAGRDPKI